MPGRDANEGQRKRIGALNPEKDKWYVVEESGGKVTSIIAGPFDTLGEAAERDQDFQHWSPVYARRWTEEGWSKT